MWKMFGAFLRTIFRKRLPGAMPAPAAPPAEVMSAIRQELRDLLSRRSRLREAIASYRDFGYAALAQEATLYLATVEAKIRTYPSQLVSEGEGEPWFATS